MRIAVFGDAWSPNVQQWSEGLRSQGHEVEVVSFEQTDDALHTTRRLRGRWLRGLRYLAAIPAARRAVRALQPDLVVGYFVTGYGTLARWAGQGHPVVQVTAGSDLLTVAGNTFAGALGRRNLRRADLVITWAPHMADQAKRAGVPPQRILTQVRGISLEGYTPHQQTSSPAPVRAVSTRALEPKYRIEVILTALASVPDLHLEVVGIGSARDDLATLASLTGIDDRVRFHGKVPNAEMGSLLASHDLYVSAVPTDGVSASLLEAMAAGVFPIVVDNEANRAWIEPGRNGLLYDGTAEALARALHIASDDPELRRRAATINQQVVQDRADIRRTMPEFSARLAELLDSRRSS